MYARTRTKTDANIKFGGGGASQQPTVSTDGTAEPPVSTSASPRLNFGVGGEMVRRWGGGAYLLLLSVYRF